MYIVRGRIATLQRFDMCVCIVCGLMATLPTRTGLTTLVAAVMESPMISRRRCPPAGMGAASVGWRCPGSVNVPSVWNAHTVVLPVLYLRKQYHKRNGVQSFILSSRRVFHLKALGAKHISKQECWHPFEKGEGCYHVCQYGVIMYASMVLSCMPVWCHHVCQYGVIMYASMVFRTARPRCFPA